MKNNNILCGMGINSNAGSTESYPEHSREHQGDELRDRRRAVLNLFLEDNPAFEVCLRNLQARDLQDNDRIVLKAYKDEPLDAQIERYCLNLQSVLFTLSVFPDAKIPDEVLDGFFDMAGTLIYALHHLAEGVGDDADEDAPGLRCAPSGLRVGPGAEEANMKLIRQKKVPALALLRLLRGESL